MSELLPCPFCGRTKYLTVYHRNHRYYPKEGMYAVKCKRCGIRGRYQLSEKRAIIAWNERPTSVVDQCSIVKIWTDSDYLNEWRYRCSECGYAIPVDERDYETGDVISAANYCPHCGRKVIG